MPKNKSWYSIECAAKGVMEITIYEEIGYLGVTDSDFVKDLNRGLKDKPSAINVRINSPGGDVRMAMGIYTALQRQKEIVTTFVDGWAASAASVIAIAGNKTIIAPQAMFMIHNPVMFAFGDADGMNKTAEMLRKIGESIAAVYNEKTGKPIEEIQTAMNAETWMNAEESIEFGLADEIGIDDTAPKARFDPKKAAQNFVNFREEYAVAAGPIERDSWIGSLVERVIGQGQKPEENLEMDWKDIDLDGLRQERPDLVTALTEGVRQELSATAAAASEAQVALTKKVAAQLRPYHFSKAEGEAVCVGVAALESASVEDAFALLMSATERHAVMTGLEKETAETVVATGGKEEISNEQKAGDLLVQAASGFGHGKPADKR